MKFDPNIISDTSTNIRWFIFTSGSFPHHVYSTHEAICTNMHANPCNVCPTEVKGPKRFIIDMRQGFLIQWVHHNYDLSQGQCHKRSNIDLGLGFLIQK